jgi:hypothetical protein
VLADTGGVAGSGDIVAEARSLGSFDRVVLAGEGTVVITHGAGQSVMVETDENLLQYIDTSVVDGTLEIRTSADVDIAPSDSVVYEIAVVELNAVELTGAGSIHVGRWSTDHAHVALGGTGTVRIEELLAPELAVECVGVGTISIAGEVGHQEVSAAGMGEYAAADLESRTASVVGTAGGAATIWVTESLEVDVADSATVAYYGMPEVDEVTSGGAITPLGAR